MRDYAFSIIKCFKILSDFLEFFTDCHYHTFLIINLTYYLYVMMRAKS